MNWSLAFNQSPVQIMVNIISNDSREAGIIPQDLVCPVINGVIMDVEKWPDFI